MGRWPTKVTIKEVGPRDGLQNEASPVATADKIAWINLLSETGLSYIEVTSFVHPKWIPQLADAAEVAAGIRRKDGVTYAALVPNEKGLERALRVGVDEVGVFMSASETHNQKNINKTIAATFPVLEGVVKAAKQERKTVRGYVSTVFGCPYEGTVAVDQVLMVADRLFAMGVDELSLGDTIGVATPKQVEDVLAEVLRRFPAEQIAMHFHDTRGTALANILVSMEMGITTFDSSLGGLGGCPYAPGASGNVATDDLVYMLHGMGVETGIDVEQLTKAALFIRDKIGRPLPSRYLQTISS
ncbi:MULTISPECIES: hydroxymethylglutaryl-CoA lyase [Geobacillus]|jgi:hydroxymethylglutaryl-CoA lyase|uniref:Hydroxymethylglutaryl-CoA lyase n=3 Tax=Geobacillus thermodenitrificans TaxID=33940 RepID=A4INB6_GEOTN|nr:MULTISPECIES: hydroxymethylglutaryl-CoA lyase [Geobacillus]ABO66820.1 Hydroxymethylglutaryl-CoA lyase [Geobacillus thermodenitrificans NG80-2]ARP42587.1 Hydroxymethylglutaryl-CoA lyase [Geobacillus thermodenitrificans]ATO36102.1 hydroxymethylglutaryl-CoA lyase [Geobacillus thermodenitrificans]KQB93528.1 Hydroxymethylglutaryl-CoA lyase YngG [Geobacillus sp. PA-3]MEC5186485.1 hydroxymethylglutaryl-CoA lyase [Geobacillus thermodenitrificans]